MSRYLVAVPFVLAVCGCSDFAEDLNQDLYVKDVVSSVDDLEDRSYTSKNLGEKIILADDAGKSAIYECVNGAWVGEDADDKIEYKKSSASKGVSSSGAQSSSFADDVPGSSGQAPVIVSPSSGSMTPVVVEDISSSGMNLETGEVGTCAETTGKTSITKGESARFAVALNSQSFSLMDVAKATYEWHYGQGVSDGSANGRTSDNVVFTESGEAAVSVTVTVGGMSAVIPCPLHVNGDPIKGCECTTAATTADYTATQDVANSIVEVACPAVKTTQGAEYLIKVEQNQVPLNKIKVPNEGCITVEGEWTEPSYLPSLMVFCDLMGRDVSLSIIHGADVVTHDGAYGVINLGLKLGKVSVGAINYGNICVKYTAESFTEFDSGFAECGLATN